MIQKIDACLKERGYSFIKVSPEEVGVYYRFTEGRAQVVAGIFMHPGFVLETENCRQFRKTAGAVSSSGRKDSGL